MNIKTNKQTIGFLGSLMVLLAFFCFAAASHGQTNVTVTVLPNAYTLAYNSGSHGTISGTNPQRVAEGADGTEVIAVPNPGYHFVDWSDGLSTANRTDTNITANASYSANFVINTYTLTYSAGANGSINGTSPQTVNYNSSGSTVRAVPDSGYQFVNWNDGSTQNPRTDHNVHSNLSVTANFSNAATLTYLAGANGTIVGSTTQVILIGGDGTPVTATANSGYHFVSWSDGILNAARTDTNISSDLTVTANFAMDAFALTYKSDSGGSISGDTIQSVNYGQDGTEVTANSDTGYKFKDWSDGSSDNPRKDTNVKGDLVVTAQFEKKTYSLKYNAGANGSLSGDTNQSVKYGDDGNSVTAVPDTGYHFVDWNDNSTENPRTDSNVKEDLEVTANFASDNAPIVMPGTFTLSYAAGNNGTISGSANQTVVAGGTGTAISAAPNSGYHFVSWSDGSTQNPRIDSNVQANLSVSASFTQNTDNGNTPPPNTPTTPDSKNTPGGTDQPKEILSNVKTSPDQTIATAIIPIIPEQQQTPIAVATTVALATTLLPLFYQIGSAKNVLIFLRDLPVGILGLFSKAKKRKTWGTVYDSATGDPISLVSISVIDAKDGKVKESKLTDKYGSYYFLVPEGEYQLEIQKKGYEIDSHDIDAKTYYTNVLTEPDKKKLIYDAPGMIFYDLCMKSTSLDQKSIKDKRLSYLFFASIFYLGFIFTIFVYLSNPTKLNLFLVIIYFINIIVRNLNYLGSKWGHVFNKEGVKQPFSAISLLDKATKQLVARTISDEQGRYILLANQGEYTLKTITNVNRFAQKEEDLSLGERGVIKKRIVV